MVNSILEITDNEYLIKLNRQNFNLSFIRSLLKIVEVANPVEDTFSTADKDFRYDDNFTASEPSYFSSLEEK